MRGTAAIVAAATLLVVGCGDDSKKDGAKEPGGSASGSSLDCMEKSVISPHRYSSKRDEGIEKGVRPLFTRGAKGAEILTGQLGAVVIEYPDELGAARALRAAKASRVLRQYVSPKRISAIERTLFIDYAKTGHVRRIVTACARNPDEPPPTP